MRVVRLPHALLGRTLPDTEGPLDRAPMMSLMMVMMMMTSKHPGRRVGGGPWRSTVSVGTPPEVHLLLRTKRPDVMVRLENVHICPEIDTVSRQ